MSKTADAPIVRELDVPDGIRDASEAVEVYRAWIADGALHVTFDPETFRHDASEWGRLLADSAQHIAAAIALTGDLDAAAALALVKRGFDDSLAAEVAAPSEGRVGHIKRGKTH